MSETTNKQTNRKVFIPIRILRKLNISHKIADHLVGPNHTDRHQKTIGVGVMMVGVIIAKGSAGVDFAIIHILGDVIGYFIHAVGALPWIKNLEIVERPIIINKDKTEEDNGNE